MAKREKDEDLLMYEEAKLEFVNLFDYFTNRFWFLSVVTCLALILAIIGFAFAYHASDKIQIRERIVLRDKFGLLTPIDEIKAGDEKVDKQVIAAHLKQYIEDIRTITIDQQANTNMYIRAKKMTDIAVWTNKVKPEMIKHWVSVGDGTTVANSVVVFVNTVPMQTGTNTWEVNWIEYLNGQTTPENTTYWKAIIAISTFTPSDADTILNNPAGITIKDIGITQNLDWNRSN